MNFEIFLILILLSKAATTVFHLNNGEDTYFLMFFDDFWKCTYFLMILQKSHL